MNEEPTQEDRLHKKEEQLTPEEKLRKETQQYRELGYKRYIIGTCLIVVGIPAIIVPFLLAGLPTAFTFLLISITSLPFGIITSVYVGPVMLLTGHDYHQNADKIEKQIQKIQHQVQEEVAVTKEEEVVPQPAKPKDPDTRSAVKSEEQLTKPKDTTVSQRIAFFEQLNKSQADNTDAQRQTSRSR